MDDLLNEFLTETAESLAVIDVELVKFEQNPNDAEILQNIFRLVHTIKGTCGFLGLPRLEAVAHAGENVLGKFRDGELDVTPEAVTLILRCIDVIRVLLGELEETGAEPAGDDSEVISALNAMAEGRTAEAQPATDAAPPPPPAADSMATGPVASEDGFPVAKELLDEVLAAQASGAQAASDAEILAEIASEHTDPDDTGTGTTATPPDTAAGSATVAPASDQAAAAEPAAKTPAKSNVPATADEAKVPKESSVAAQSIRVNVDLLENLMTLVSEMVLTRNQLMQMVRGQDDSVFKTPLQRLSLITTDLQEGVMKTRMQPIGNAWAKLPRIVRDLGVETGKKIDLQMVGADTELDRQVLELIKDPLTHMVRNSADHGLETPEERQATDKPETGVITLNAYHEGGHIIIKITDDGRGLNTARIKAKAIENGLASEAELEGMTDQQIHQFIMRPGFSTAERVTSVSGRGVGMDVVRTNIERIGGTMELASKAGRGSTFTIKIPLTLAIVSALIVECGGERFAIPQISVLELVRASSNSEHVIETINDSPVLRLRDHLLALVSLQDLLKIGERGETGDDEVFIVITQVGTYTFGIIVDRVFDTEEIVVKPVAPILRDIPYYSGNTILGDGSVIMILDPNGIAAATGQAAIGETAAAAAATSGYGGTERSSLLIFRAGGDELKAVPLALVARLEEIDMAQVEHAHGQYVVQYRGHLMPLIPFDPAHQWQSEGRQPILVFTEGEHSMGLVVDDIVDIVEDQLNVELSAKGDGFMGSAIIDGKATDVIDTAYYLTKAFPNWFGSAAATSFGGDHDAKRVMLVDDSPFFRNLLAPLLSVAGYNVTAVESASEALRRLESGETYHAIVSDIEMPGMDGFEFAEAVRRDSRWTDMPLVALSSHATQQDIMRGREAGFSDYVAKFDRDAVITALSQLVSADAKAAA